MVARDSVGGGGGGGRVAALAAPVYSAVRSSSQGQQGSAVLLGSDDLQALKGGHIPHPDGAPRSAVQALAADGNALHRLLVAPERVHTLALSCVPHLPAPPHSCRNRTNLSTTSHLLPSQACIIVLVDQTCATSHKTCANCFARCLLTSYKADTCICAVSSTLQPVLRMVSVR